MTFVGKVLVVVQVVLSVCFMAFAGAVYTAQTNWMAKSATVQEQLDKQKADYNTLQGEFEKLQSELTVQLKAEQDRANAAEAANAGLTQQLAAVRQELETVKTERDTQRAQAQIAGEEARIRREEALAQRRENDRLHQLANDLEAKRRALEDELFNKNIETENMLAKHERLLDDYKTLQRVIQANNLNPDPKNYRDRQTPPPLVAGKVLNKSESSRRDSEFIEISIGSDDGLVEGHEVYVYRTGSKNGDRPKYLGKARIVHVVPDKAVAEVIQPAKNGVIERGDDVTTKL